MPPDPPNYAGYWNEPRSRYEAGSAPVINRRLRKHSNSEKSWQMSKKNGYYLF